MELALARSFTEQGVCSTEGPPIDEMAAHMRLAGKRAQREATAKEAELKDPKGKGIVEIEQAEEDYE